MITFVFLWLSLFELLKSEQHLVMIKIARIARKKNHSLVKKLKHIPVVETMSHSQSPFLSNPSEVFDVATLSIHVVTWPFFMTK